MRKAFFYVFIMLLGLVSTVSSQQVKTQSADYKKLWSKADSLINEGLPKSAKEVILLIYNKSKKENDVQQYIKSLIYKLKVESLVEENYSVKAIVLLEEEIKNAAFPQKQILYSMLAELYWNYYQENRYNILQRSITVNFSDKDIETWDLLKIVSKTMDCYNNSLTNIQDLRNIKIEQIEGILIKAKNSEKYRPTLYDFLAFRALDFYMEEESDLTRPAYKFELNKIDYFSSADVFAKMTITTKDTFALKFYAVKLMQQLLTFHSGDNNSQALVDADLLRLKFVRDNSILPAKDSLYIISLQRNAKKYEGQAVAADIFYDLALAYYKRDARGDYISTVDLCERLIKEYPVSVAAANAAVLMADIKQASLALTVEFGNTIKMPVRALVEYKNTETLYLRLINIDYDEDAKLRQSNYGRALIDVYTKNQITEEWQIKLPVDKDFKTHKTEIKIPAQNAGYFILLASDNAGFSYNKGIVTYQNLWFSDLSYIKKNNLDGSVSFYVLNRTTGNPVEGVNVQSFLKYYDYQSRAYVNEKWKNFITDKKGFFSVPYQEDKQKYRTISVVFSYKKDKFTTDDYFSQYKSGYEQEASKVIKSFFFTDRAIYRPGQTIYFKGIIIEKQGKKSEIKPDYSTIVYFYDVNQTEIAKLKLKSNEFGSFSGSFTAPQGGLTGYMYITDKIGLASFSVEEYKRPKFEVTYNPVAGSFRLGETLTVKGTAMAYAGFPIDNATVKYNVRRVARFPFFNEWWCR
nr:hypothetical protein [Bacteroidales bacterium]